MQPHDGRKNGWNPWSFHDCWYLLFHSFILTIILYFFEYIINAKDSFFSRRQSIGVDTVDVLHGHNNYYYSIVLSVRKCILIVFESNKNNKRTHYVCDINDSHRLDGLFFG